MIHHIHIFGASGSGTTTLGKEIERVCGYKHLDTDDYFWETKYSKIRDIPERIQLIKEEIKNYDTWVLTGSLCGWGDVFIPLFDLVIFVYIPKNERMKRLHKRESERYGSLIESGNEKHTDYIKFMAWAEQYDDGDETVRSKVVHTTWMATLKCSVVKIEGMHTLSEEIELCRKYIECR